MDSRSKGTENHLHSSIIFFNSLEQLADWLETYANVMELNVWTSSTVTSAEKDSSGIWIVNLTRILPDGTEVKRVLRPTHLVFATGLGGGSLVIPKFPNQVLRSLPFILNFAHGTDVLSVVGSIRG